MRPHQFGEKQVEIPRRDRLLNLWVQMLQMFEEVANPGAGENGVPDHSWVQCRDICQVHLDERSCQTLLLKV